MAYHLKSTTDTKLVGVTLAYTHSYEIHECVIKKGTSGEEKAASRTQIMKEEEFLLLGKLKTECCNYHFRCNYRMTNLCLYTIYKNISLL